MFFWLLRMYVKRQKIFVKADVVLFYFDYEPLRQYLLISISPFRPGTHYPHVT